MGDMTKWVSYNLIPLLGYSHRTVVAFVIGVAKKAKSPVEILKELESVDVTPSNEAKTFVQQLFSRIERKASGPNVYEQRQREAALLLRKQATYSILQDDDEDDNAGGEDGNDASAVNRSRKEDKQDKHGKKFRKRSKPDENEDDEEVEVKSTRRRTSKEESDGSESEEERLLRDQREREELEQRMKERDAANTRKLTEQKLSKKDEEEAIRRSKALQSDETGTMRGKECSIAMQSLKDEISAKLRRQADIALELFYQNNGTCYKLVDYMVGNSIYSEGYWFHFNFKAQPPKDDIDGESSSKLFFAENNTGISETENWISTACHLLDGKTTDGCIFCKGVIHPTHGFCQGITRAQIASSPLCNTIPCDSEAENHDRRAEVALEYFNKEHGTNYELVLLMAQSKCLSSGYHYNFEAKQEVEGEYSWRIFFAEVLSTFHLGRENLTASACLILEAGETTAGCSQCSDIIHPASWEIPKGNHEFLSSNLTNAPTCLSKDNPDDSQPFSPSSLISPSAPISPDFS